MSDFVNSVLKALDSATSSSNIFTQNVAQPEQTVEAPKVEEKQPETKEAE
jgi:hypothetical protein